MPITLPGGGGGMRAVWFQQETVTNVVRSLTLPVGVVPYRIIMSIHTGGLRVTWHGVDPTTLVGHQLVAGAVGQARDASGIFELLGSLRILALRYIRDGTVDSEIAYTLEV